MNIKFFWYGNIKKGMARPGDFAAKCDVIANFNRQDWNTIYNEAISIARSHREYMSYHSEDMKNRRKHINKHKIEWNRKFTLSIACLILFFIGAPLGAIIRKGGFGMPMVISVVFFVSFHIMTMTGEKMAREGAATPFEGMWLPIAIILPIGIFLTYKASRDSSLFNIDTYFGFFRFSFLKRTKKKGSPA
jgi:lipopolysaccharide export system permease protein